MRGMGRRRNWTQMSTQRCMWFELRLAFSMLPLPQPAGHRKWQVRAAAGAAVSPEHSKIKLVEGGEEGGEWGEGGMREEQEERKKEGNHGHSTKDKGIEHLSWEEKSIPSI